MKLFVPLATPIDGPVCPSRRLAETGEAVETAPYWDAVLGEIDAKRGKVRQMGYFLRSKHKDHANKDGTMSKEEQAAYIKKFQAELISEADEAKWKRGASNAGYHYLGCAKTMAQIGKAFAEALIAL